MSSVRLAYRGMLRQQCESVVDHRTRCCCGVAPGKARIFPLGVRSVRIGSPVQARFRPDFQQFTPIDSEVAESGMESGPRLSEPYRSPVTSEVAPFGNGRSRGFERATDGIECALANTLWDENEPTEGTARWVATRPRSRWTPMQ